MNLDQAPMISARLVKDFRSTFLRGSIELKFQFLRRYFIQVGSVITPGCACLPEVTRGLSDSAGKSDKMDLEKACASFIIEELSKINYKPTGKSELGERSNALLFMGMAHEIGALGMIMDLKMAFNYYTMAVHESFNSIAFFKLGQCYERGIGTYPNTDRAVMYYRIAAKTGLVEALHTFGVILVSGGLGVYPNPHNGLFYLKMAVRGSDSVYPYPYFDLAKCYDPVNSDTCVERDASYAFELYMAGARLGCPNCQHRIAKAYERAEFGLNRDVREAMNWYLESAACGNVDSQLDLSSIYLRGLDGSLESDLERARFWAKKASLNGCNDAMLDVDKYMDGRRDSRKEQESNSSNKPCRGEISPNMHEHKFRCCVTQSKISRPLSRERK